MSNPVGDKLAEAVKSLGSEMKDAVDGLSSKLETAVEALGRELDRLGRLVGLASQGSIRFEVKATTEFGESILVVGNHARLGNWDPAQGFVLDGQTYPLWTGRLEQLSAGAPLEYKYVRKTVSGAFVWESVSANRSTTPTPGETVVSDEPSWEAAN